VEWGTRAMVKFHEATRVKFRVLTVVQIQDYLASIDPLDKAGAYAAQEDGGRIIECIEGSFSNVVGLPVERVSEILKERFDF
jgi:septum formation protein